ncbi:MULTISPECIES: hypothetical protein [Pseudomonas]|uniref:Uncharacterized protein n=1 Tax=Pseudomonas beijingensis TaxID=2954101 RepID=A0ABY9FGP8_9PSED|nr:hypothetical protein [Pseudomonas sp. FP2034]WLH02714.1 hypothetical protein PSH92_07560 [Pseudomonas sp. FP2034]
MNVIAGKPCSHRLAPTISPHQINRESIAPPRISLEKSELSICRQRFFTAKAFRRIGP